MVKSCTLCGHIHAAGTPHQFDGLDQMADTIPAVRNALIAEMLAEQEDRAELKRKPGRPRKGYEQE